MGLLDSGDLALVLVGLLALVGLALLFALAVWVAALRARLVRVEAKLEAALERIIAAAAAPPRSAGQAAAEEVPAAAGTGAAPEPPAAREAGAAGSGRRLPLRSLAEIEAAAGAPRPADPAAEGAAAAGIASAQATPEAEGPLVLREDRFIALGHWIRANWVYVVSALSLALAGVYFVQYGIEKGLLSPAARVLGALCLGAILTGFGEWLRRRQQPGGPTAFLPATFAGAGLVSMFAGIVAARQLYDLVGPGTGLLGLVLVSLGAVVLGWFHGAFLTAFGLIGAAAAPFIVGGSSDDPSWLYLWFLAIGCIGLAVDAVRRWAWISVLALALGYGGLWLVHAGIGGAGWFALAVSALTLVGLTLPGWALAPAQRGPMLSATLLGQSGGAWPGFPTRLAAGAVAVAALSLVLIPSRTVADSQMVFHCLAGLGLALVLWTRNAPALADLAALPLLAFLGRLLVEPLAAQPLAYAYDLAAIARRPLETDAPWTVTILLALAVALTLALAWRSQREPRDRGWLRALWAAGAALTAPLAALALDRFWFPVSVIGAWPWALHVMALAALMTALAAWFARADGEDRRRAAYAVLAALSLIALALFILITRAALTVALAVLPAVAAALDRRFRLPELGWFIQAGVVVLGWRLLVDPGVIWAVDAPLWEVLLGYGGALGGLALAWLALPGNRPGARVLLESGFAAAAALLANVLLVRWMAHFEPIDPYWALSLNALPWLVVAQVQLWRFRLGGWMRWIRGGLAAVSALLWAGPMALAVFPFNPLFDGRVRGPVLFDSLALAYALPGALLWAGLRLAPWRWLRWGQGALAAALLALWAGLEIRRWFRGPNLTVHGVSQGELYAYTVAMMLTAAVLLARALQTGSRGRRWAAMGLIALTVAKVFLIDGAGLTGLMRVVSFLLLGLALAGVAFLNRWAASLERSGEGADDRRSGPAETPQKD